MAFCSYSLVPSCGLHLGPPSSRAWPIPNQGIIIKLVPQKYLFSVPVGVYVHILADEFFMPEVCRMNVACR